MHGTRGFRSWQYTAIKSFIGTICSIFVIFSSFSDLISTSIGFGTGFVGAGGGMMMLFVLTTFLGYQMHVAVGTSVFIMTFTALTGGISHFAIGGMPDVLCMVFCVLFTLLWARIAARFANKSAPKTLNRVTGVILVVLSAVVLGFDLITR